MRRSFAPIALAALALVLAGSSTARTDDGGQDGIAYAIIGDTPYGGSQLADFPRLVSASTEIRMSNSPSTWATSRTARHPAPTPTSTRCVPTSTRCRIRLSSRRRQRVDRLPSPGCGSRYSPTERLAQFRSVFYPRANKSLGETQQQENPGPHARLRDVRRKPAVEGEKVVFATVHVVGSNNDLVPWFGSAETPAQREERLAEYDPSAATSHGSTAPSPSQTRRRRVASSWRCSRHVVQHALGFTEIVPTARRLSARIRQARPTLEGDSHRFTVDRPLTTGSALHGARPRQTSRASSSRVRQPPNG